MKQNDINEIIKLPYKTITELLTEFYMKQNQEKLLDILNAVVNYDISDLIVNKNILFIAGWFVNNNLFPEDVLDIFLNKISKCIDNDFLKEINILFGKSIMPSLFNHIDYCNKLLSIKDLMFIDNPFYIFLKEVIKKNYKISLEDKTNFCFKPKIIKEKFEILGKKENNYNQKEIVNSHFDIKDCLENEIKKAYSIKNIDLQFSYYVQILEEFDPPESKYNGIYSKTILESVNKYLRILLFNYSKKLKWNSYSIYPLLKKLGKWINSLSTNLPPLYIFNVHSLILECANNGVICHLLIFLKSFLSGLDCIFSPPNPYVSLILEILAAIINVPRIRTDISEKIYEIADIWSVDINSFYHKDIIIPLNSFDISHSFDIKKVSESNLYENQINDKGFIAFFLDLISRIKKIKKYYFAIPLSIINVNNININININDLIFMDSINSNTLSFVSSKMVSKTFSSFLEFDLRDIFNSNLPSQYFLFSLFQKKCLNHHKLNSLFSELLTSSEAQEKSFPLIFSLMTFIKPEIKDNYVSTIKLLKLINHDKVIKHNQLPNIDQNHLPLLSSFLSFAKQKDDDSRSKFISNLIRSNSLHFVSLFTFVFLVSKKRNSSKLPSIIDYSAIDNLCLCIGKCAGRIDSKELSYNIFNALKIITGSAIYLCPLNLFRLIYKLFSSLRFYSKRVLIELLQYLNPYKYPFFAICWIQLVMHKSIFPQLIKSNELSSHYFCLDFLNICFFLCQKEPDLFYHGVIRILITILQCSPSFFQSNYYYILENLPLNFIQFRNIISTPNMEDETKFELYEFEESELFQQIQQILINHNYITIDTNTKEIVEIIRKYIDNQKSYIPRLIWQFILYIIYNFSNLVSDINKISKLPIIKLLCNIIQLSDIKVDNIIINAIIDNLNVPNHKFVSSMLSILFTNSTIKTKEIILVLLIKRLLCVSHPSIYVFETFTCILSKEKQNLNVKQKTRFMKIFNSINMLYQNI